MISGFIIIPMINNETAICFDDLGQYLKYRLETHMKDTGVKIFYPCPLLERDKK